ncbi:acyltransferase family protein [Pseudoalteromonas sp. T1lg65]|uniref:acyltransferase family protein n=1 Tax=Pseudoalteromonas sp. T1lg65 TaxID=2077101 RepID=UPI003F7AE950
MDITQTTMSRRVELDWLRVIAFGALIFYHIGMLYSPNWGFHYKSAYLAPWTEYLMLLFSPWRMLLIWFISGVALRFILDKYGPAKTLLQRTPLLLLPLLFGVWFVVPVQLFAEMVQDGAISLTFPEFYRHFFDLDSRYFTDYQSGIWPHVDVNHLWYLRELWRFTLIIAIGHWLFTSQPLAAIKPYLTSQVGGVLISCFAFIVLLWAQISLAGDAKREVQGFIFLAFGYFIARNDCFFEMLANNRKLLMWVCLLNATLLLLLYHFYWLPNNVSKMIKVLGLLSLSVQQVAAVLGILALAGYYLNRPHPILHKLNRAVFPVYIWHQSVIIAVAFWLSQYQLGGMLEFILIVVANIVVALACFVLIPKMGVLGLLMGYRAKHLPLQTWFWLLGCLVVTPVILRIL